jgi:hypothetical protein
MFALLVGQSIDFLHMSADGEETLPSCNRVSADYWVLSTQIFPKILRGTTRALENFKAAVFRKFVELRLRKRYS